MQIALGQLAELVGGRVDGDAGVLIAGVAGIREAGPDQITFAAIASYGARYAAETNAAAVVVAEGAQLDGCRAALLRSAEPDLAFARIAEQFAPEPVRHPPGIHPAAVVAEGVQLGRNVSIGPNAVIEAGARIGDNTAVLAQAYVGRQSVIGADCVLHPGVKVRERITIGDRVIIHCGAVIGSDGFGFVTVKGRHVKVPQVGTVTIEDDVEIGANVTIDRARFDTTVIGRGTKIDNLVQIAHNVRIGEHCFVVAQVGIAGSARLGNYCILAGQSGVAGHVELGDRVIVAGRGGVTTNVQSGEIVSGFPAQPRRQELRVQASVRRLPQMLEDVRELKKRVSRVEAASEND